jgi:hypothetical protein
MIFGIHGENMRLCHIIEFVERIVDGFKVKSRSDIGAAALAFATALGYPRHSLLWDFMIAFSEGIKADTETMRYFASRRRT